MKRIERSATSHLRIDLLHSCSILHFIGAFTYFMDNEFTPSLRTVIILLSPLLECFKMDIEVIGKPLCASEQRSMVSTASLGASGLSHSFGLLLPRFPLLMEQRALILIGKSFL